MMPIVAIWLNPSSPLFSGTSFRKLSRLSKLLLFPMESLEIIGLSE
jgi:hypothetical protein